MRCYDACQEHADFCNALPEELFSLITPWSFYQWGLDILGPFPPAAGQVKFLIVDINYFTKWIEAEPLTTISLEKIHKFF